MAAAEHPRAGDIDRQRAVAPRAHGIAAVDLGCGGVARTFEPGRKLLRDAA